MLYCAVFGMTDSWIDFAFPPWQIMMIPHGILIAFLFTMQHECTHNTPFRSLWLNSAIGHLIAFLLYQPFLWFRFFHLAHHKYTNIAGKDPELDGNDKTKQLGRVFTPSLYLGLLVGQGHNLAREQRWAAYCTLYPTAQTAGPACRSGPVDCGLCRCFCNDAHRPAVAVTVAVGCAADPWVSRVAPVPIGRIRTLPRGGEHVLNTRTTLTTRVVRFLAWNMPYHAEHHAMPSVPFHKLPTLHNMTAAHLGRVSDGYSEFSKAYVSSFRD